MEKMTYTEYKNALKELGISYLAGVKQSAKMAYSFNNGYLTLGLYLAPADLSGHNVCPRSEHCKDLCLNGAGHNKADIIAHGVKESKINISRIKKTNLFYDNRELFMRMLCYEIEQAQRSAERRGMEFCVRLNCTSDLSPLAFKLDGKNILELYPNVQFYDYTKVGKRMKLPTQYKNYDLTFSFDGFNWETCKEYLKQGGRVAVVFDSDTLPIAYKGWNVINANDTDMRFLDGHGVICGLHFHRPASLYVNGKYIGTDSPFVVRENEPYCTYAFKPNEREE